MGNRRENIHAAYSNLTDRLAGRMHSTGVMKDGGVACKKMFPDQKGEKLLAPGIIPILSLFSYRLTY